VICSPHPTCFTSHPTASHDVMRRAGDGYVSARSMQPCPVTVIPEKRFNIWE
jgi:hypothetical protein